MEYIVKIEELIRSVHKRPKMYFGNGFCENKANQIIYELVANSIDQFLAGKATQVEITIENNYIQVSDDGEGFRFAEKSKIEPNRSVIIDYFTILHNKATVNNHAPHIHVGNFGLGLAIVNATSKSIQIASYNEGSLWTLDFVDSKLTGEPKCYPDKTGRGTIILVELDQTFFGDNYFNRDELRKIFFELAHLYRGLSISFDGEKFLSRNGLLDLCLIYHDRCVCYPLTRKKFSYQTKINNIQVEVAVIGNAKSKTRYKSWVNGVLTYGHGTHVKGLSQALKNNNWKADVAMIHILMHDPKYAGPFKDVLMMPELINLLETVLTPEIAKMKLLSE